MKMSKRQRNSLFDEGLFLFTENLLPHSVQLAQRAQILKSNRIIKEVAAHPAVRGRIDAVLRDPDDPHRMQAGLHMGDGVHPNWRGGSRMAQALMKMLFGS